MSHRLVDVEAGGSVYRAGGMFIWIHEFDISRSFHTVSALDVPRLLCWQTKWMSYISLFDKMDVQMEGVDKVQQHSDIA